jgi:hydroxymethylglutaryl-CoA reductase (NADPH)
MARLTERIISTGSNEAAEKRSRKTKLDEMGASQCGVTDFNIGAGDLLPRLRDGGYDKTAVTKRRKWLKDRVATPLDHVGGYTFDPEELRGNIENLVGVTQVPLGIAGPVIVLGQHARGRFYVPMATSEGALIRSYERGMVALSHAGGVQTAILEDENQIAPAFLFTDVRSAEAFTCWVEDNAFSIRAEAESTTGHGKLTSMKCYQIGRQVLVNLGFSTGDAQGMNMIAKAADAVCRWIQEKYSGCSYLLFSGLCSEKRPSGFVLTRGKGKRVAAGALLPHRVLKIYLHVTAEQMHQVWRTTVLGHLQAGSLGYNAHCANGLAAMFIATGQDVANVVHAACSLTSFEPHPEGLYVSVTLPALSVATVGGGTGLPSQHEALKMMGCYGKGKAGKLAEIMAAAVLGGEISMGAALASGEFVAAHERYGRNRPK